MGAAHRGNDRDRAAAQETDPADLARRRAGPVGPEGWLRPELGARDSPHPFAGGKSAPRGPAGPGDDGALPAKRGRRVPGGGEASCPAAQRGSGE